jgi:hypothetical protein
MQDRTLERVRRRGWPGSRENDHLDGLASQERQVVEQ